MRRIDEKKSEKRKRKILQAAVHHYIKTGVPAGSKVLVDNYGFNLSPATVRNILSELESEGYLTHLHTSSGRIPTDKGYRTYVDMLAGVQNIVVEEMERLRAEHKRKMLELEDILINTSKILSALSRYSGFVSLPTKENTLIKNIEFIPLKEKQVLFVFVTNTGLVRHKLLNVVISPRNLRYLSALLKEKLEGSTLLDAQRGLPGIIDELNFDMAEISNIADVMKDIFCYENDFYIDGLSNIAALPEFRDYNIPEALTRRMDRRNPLVKVLASCLSDDNIKVIIGSETHCKGFDCISAVTGTYRKDERPLGVLGIIGPKRMEYKKMISIVNQVSRMLGDILKKTENHEEK